MRRFALLTVLMLGITLSAHASEGLRGSKFRDCPDCPEMIIIPAGGFVMGSPPTEVERNDPSSPPLPYGAVNPNEGPQHAVQVRAFAAGIYDVTRAEYAQFIHETGYAKSEDCWYSTGKPFDEKGSIAKSPDNTWHDPGFPQTERDPVVCVSWDDAHAYLTWLNRKVGGQTTSARASAGPYRLLSEAEWEYAARAGTHSRYYWGDEISHDNANFGVAKCPPCGPLAEGKDRWNYTSPVGSFAPNAFGLYDMTGNVFQEVEDCYHPTYEGAPSDGSAWVTGECKFRIGRGGDWFDDAAILRLAFRDYEMPSHREYFSGFRVAKTLE